MSKRYIVSLLSIFILANAGAAEPKPQLGFIKGYTWGWVGQRNEYMGERPERSLELLAGTGTEWIALAFGASMKTKDTPGILYGGDNPAMVADEEIRRAIELARKHRFKIIMKPVVNCQDGTWRALIEFKTEKDWAAWWQNYEAFMLHYAKIAADAHCEMLCVGCEMSSTEKFAEHWRRLIAEVRKIYKGPIVYNANHDAADGVKWFDAVDIIGISAYYPVATQNDRSLEKMLAGWKPIREKLAKLHAKWQKPILFIEIGVRSAAGCSTMPWDWSHAELPYDGEEQARYYQAALESFWDQPWFLGFCWWDWKAQLYKQEEAKTNKDFCIYGKPAEAVLKDWYHRRRD